jgi:OOP family OmpA-OmpF porin
LASGFKDDVKIAPFFDYKKAYVIGYWDFKGSDEYNKTLSEQRASAVAQYLEQKRIEIADIRLEGRGEVNDGKTRWLNRRVEV